MWVLLASLAGCTGPDTFFVRRAGADLPVWVAGDPSSDTFVVVQHGMGSSGFVYDAFESFDALESRHAVVYWDQRGAGISQGNAATDTLVVEQSLADLDLVLAAVEARYAPARQVLLGHSLGGGLSLAWLRDQERAAGVDGYVDLCGGRSLPEAYALVREEMLLVGAELAADPERAAERGEWQAMVDFYQATTSFPRQGPARSIHAAYVERVLPELGYDYSGSSREMAAYLQGSGVRGALRGGFDVFAYAANTSRFLQDFPVDAMAMSPGELAAVEVPTLVLAGRFDFSVPVGVSEATYHAYAADLPPSRLVVLEDSGHWPMWDEPEAFSSAVLDFVDALP